MNWMLCALPQAGEVLAPAPAPADALAPGPLAVPPAASPGTGPVLAPALAGSVAVSMVQQLNGTGVAPLTAAAAAVLQKVTADLLQDITTGNVTVREVPVRDWDFRLLLMFQAIDREHTGSSGMNPVQSHSWLAERAAQVHSCCMA